MSENEIKPVAFVPPTFFDKGVVAATARRKPPSETAVEMRGEYLPLYDQPAIDRLTAERDALRVEAMRYREVIEYALAQHNGRHADHGNHWAAKAMNELASIDAAHAKER